MDIVLGWLIFSVLVAVLARSRGRSGFVAFLVAVFLSPLVGFIIYLILGDTKQVAYDRIKEEEEMRTRVRNEIDNRTGDKGD